MSARPWKSEGPSIFDADGKTVATTITPSRGVEEDTTNAELIVDAVNSRHCGNPLLDRQHHASLPWKQGEKHPGRIINGTQVVASVCVHQEDEAAPNTLELANAALLVRAANNHYSLINAALKLLGDLETYVNDDDDYDIPDTSALCQAIHEATGQPVSKLLAEADPV